MTPAKFILSALMLLAIVIGLPVVIAWRVAGADCQDNCNVLSGAYVRHVN